jgi:microfibrillar-associated protein 1
MERNEAEQARQDLLKRRALTDEEIMKEKEFQTREIDKDGKPKWKFMQKYYHQGVFYMDTSSVKNEADVRRQDYASGPTLEDNVDKERLPAIMRVKNFGKKGRTKYTHLVDQDTTVQGTKRMDYRIDSRIVSSFNNKRRKL